MGSRPNRIPHAALLDAIHAGQAEGLSGAEVADRIGYSQEHVSAVARRNGTPFPALGYRPPPRARRRREDLLPLYEDIRAAARCLDYATLDRLTRDLDAAHGIRHTYATAP